MNRREFFRLMFAPVVAAAAVSTLSAGEDYGIPIIEPLYYSKREAIEGKKWNTSKKSFDQMMQDAIDKALWDYRNDWRNSRKVSPVDTDYRYYYKPESVKRIEREKTWRKIKRRLGWE